jgi:hypothetical protein
MELDHLNPSINFYKLLTGQMHRQNVMDFIKRVKFSMKSFELIINL